ILCLRALSETSRVKVQLSSPLNDPCPHSCDCQHTQHLLCTNRGLHTVPKPGPWGTEDLHILSLGGNFISNISAYDFTRYSNLVQLNLQYNQIQAIDSKAFEKLSKLEELYIGHNLLSDIPVGALQPLKKLTILYGNNNVMKKITPELFTNLDNLVKLRLDGNEIEFLQDSVFKCLTSLNYLHLESNQLQQIHRNAFNKLTNLLFLNLSHNKQTAVRNVLVFSQLRSLTTLLLSDNKIQHVGNHVFQSLKRLSKLSLSNNRISRIDSGALRGLSNLRELLLDGNQLREIPAALLDHLEHIEELDFSRNRISNVDSLAFSRLNHLKVLKLKNNLLTSLSGDIFSLNKVLYDLDLHGNNWTCDCRLEDLKQWMTAAHSQGKLVTVFVRCHHPATLKGKYLDYEMIPTDGKKRDKSDQEGVEIQRDQGGQEVLDPSSFLERKKKNKDSSRERSRPSADAAGKRSKGRRRSNIFSRADPSDTSTPAPVPSIRSSTSAPSPITAREKFDLLKSSPQEALPVITDPCMFNRHYITNVSVDQVTSSTATVYWSSRNHHRYTPGPGARLEEVHYRVLFDRFGTADRFPRYVYAGGSARSVKLRELSPGVTYMVCVEGVVSGSVCQVAPRDHCAGLVTVSAESNQGPTLTSDLQLVTVATLVGNAVLLLVIGGLWVGRSMKKRLQRRKSAVHVRHMYSTRRPFRPAMATASVSTDFTSYQSSRPARLAPLEERDLIEFSCERFLDPSTARRDSEI
uniref:LRRCT domain-containing protein n=1 Tax=Gouania willdenowi TaxID=441366 RepID=A0A8C5DZN1_GOUWI